MFIIKKLLNKINNTDNTNKNNTNKDNTKKDLDHRWLQVKYQAFDIPSSNKLFGDC